MGSPSEPSPTTKFASVGYDTILKSSISLMSTRQDKLNSSGPYYAGIYHDPHTLPRTRDPLSPRGDGAFYGLHYIRSVGSAGALEVLSQSILR